MGAMVRPGREQLKGKVEVDETFIGGRSRFMHKERKKNHSGWKGMSPVHGLLLRTTDKKASQVRLKMLKTTRNHEVQGNVREYVLKGSQVFTDSLRSYIGLGKDYLHEVIDHAECYAIGKVHTNGLENFWSLLKRSLKGTYISIEPFHMFRYLDEQAWRYNNRATKEQFIGDGDRFRTAISQIVGKRLTFAEVTGKVGERAA